MDHIMAFLASLRRVPRWFLLATLPLLNACASVYVDGNVPEIPVTQYKKPAEAPNVQLLWEFQTEGAPNAQATKFLQARVHKQIADSGLFAKVSDQAAAGSALLTITVNNVPLTDDAVRKGFASGLTFGIVGTAVADGYECTLRYTPEHGGSPPLTHSGKHVIHTTIGTGSPPPGAHKTGNADEAVFLMLRQLISRVLNELSQDPSFP
ncbi:MAG: hypothetical protein LBF50_03680 [Azoarcus sp.]|jgi:hypothetical protein|nr:hypothetical protein [Azoarcus sp.]